MRLYRPTGLIELLLVLWSDLAAMKGAWDTAFPGLPLAVKGMEGA
ncbi:MAG: hypothetical protein R3F14_39580 [Polyangiaceae bacterium]